MVEGEWSRTFHLITYKTKMDGLDSYRGDPINWAASVVMDNIDEDDPTQSSESYLNSVIDECYEFIQESFLSEELEVPSREDILKVIKNSLEG